MNRKVATALLIGVLLLIAQTLEAQQPPPDGSRQQLRDTRRADAVAGDYIAGQKPYARLSGKEETNMNLKCSTG